MDVKDLPKSIQEFVIPAQSSSMEYYCLGCGKTNSVDNLLYTCPKCGEVLLIRDTNFRRYSHISGEKWRKIFDYRKLLPYPALKGVFRYYEFIAPVIDSDSIIYLGEGHTPLIEANNFLQESMGMRFFFKNDGQNPSASFKDRGMACALSYINFLINQGFISNAIAVCASTGDTSASMALYSSYLRPDIISAVLLPQGKVTPQQLLQPLGNGAAVFEIPGVFDDCMKVVEKLSEDYEVALLNSKNAWRISGQESFSYEIAQDLEYNMKNVAIVVPIGNAGNITAIMNGFLKFYNADVIDYLPKIIGVQSEHADPVYRHYLEPDSEEREFTPVTVKPSVAQAAMIGNPVSMPRVRSLVRQYNNKSRGKNVFFVQVTEQNIIDSQFRANYNGHITCTHGGETLAGLIKALDQGVIKEHEIAVLNSTAHPLKFSDFQRKYYEHRLEDKYDIFSNPYFINQPVLIQPSDLKKVPTPEKPLTGGDLEKFIQRTSEEISHNLKLKKRK